MATKGRARQRSEERSAPGQETLPFVDLRPPSIWGHTRGFPPLLPQPMRTFLRANPFLATGVLGTLIFGAWLAAGLSPRDGGVGEVVFYVWRVLAAPVHFATNVLAPVTNSWPDALDALAAVAAGLLPYALADWVLRRVRARRATT